uniref:Uncharacterized protein n=1 Tax=Arundo donax TaxID=35708 RepID=A0A0A8Y0K8_ARUDO
MIPLLQDRE